MPIATSQKPKVLFIGHSSGSPEHDAKIREVAEVHCITGMPYEESIPLVADIVERHGPFVAFGGLFVLGDKFPMKWNSKLLGPLAPECKLYVGPGAGYDKVDVDWVTSTGAYYANSPLAVGRRTADGALMLILAAMRGMTPQDLSVRSGKWRDMSVRSIDWRGATVGIVGLGNIGQQVATMCAALGMKIVYTSRSRKANVSFEHVSMEDLLARSDCVVLCCMLNDETRGLMNAERLAMMKEGSVLVNVARGPVVVEQDLVEALKAGRVMRAALDVFENEPEVHPGLMSNPNVTLSPHVAPAPDSMGKGMNSEVIDNILHYLEHGIPESPVNVKELEARDEANRTSDKHLSKHGATVEVVPASSPERIDV